MCIGVGMSESSESLCVCQDVEICHCPYVSVFVCCESVSDVRGIRSTFDVSADVPVSSNPRAEEDS